MVRTQETSAIIAERLGLPVRTDATFQEADFGEWQGLTAEQIEERWPGQLEPWHTKADLRPPGGESIEDVGRRLQRGLDALLAEGVDRTVVVVSHAVAHPRGARRDDGRAAVVVQRAARRARVGQHRAAVRGPP